MIADKAVSRIHCALDAAPDGLWVRDLGSRNGTFVSGLRVTEARIPPGGTIRLGSTEILVGYKGTPPSDPPPSTPNSETADESESDAPPLIFGKVRGWSSSLRAILERAAVLAQTETPILLEGPPGTGKKAIAQAIHDASARAEAPFVIVECAGLPTETEIGEILEAALRSAEGGTLVLDEPSELPLAVQRELVPPLDARVFRTIVTTQKDLRPLVNEGAFRESLYFRLAGATLQLAPLRHRKRDLGPLLRHFLGADADLATPELLADLERLPWPGNVRELARYAGRLRGAERDRARAVAAAQEGAQVERDDHEGTSEAPIIDPTSLEAGPASLQADQRLPPGFEPWFMTGFKEFRERWIDLGEREYLSRLMKRTQRSSGVASREAGLERTYLYRLIKKHGV